MNADNAVSLHGIIKEPAQRLATEGQELRIRGGDGSVTAAGTF